MASVARILSRMHEWLAGPDYSRAVEYRPGRRSTLEHISEDEDEDRAVADALTVASYERALEGAR